jgi:hypothetical protein
VDARCVRTDPRDKGGDLSNRRPDRTHSSPRGEIEPTSPGGNCAALTCFRYVSSRRFAVLAATVAALSSSVAQAVTPIDEPFNGSAGAGWGSSTASGTLTYPSTSAHRGTGGLQAYENTNAPNLGQAFHSLNQASSSSFYARFWARRSFSGDSQTNHGAGVYVAEVNSGSLGLANNFATLAYMMNIATGRWTFSGRGGGSEVVLADANGWGLLEIVITGIGTENGSRTAYLNGVKRAEALGLNYSGTALTAFDIGITGNTGSIYLGIDVDDVRIAAQPLASKLSVVGPPVGIGCFAITVGLIDSVAGQLQPAPYAVVANLAQSGVTGSFYFSSSCNGGAITSTTLASGATSNTVYLRATTAGTASITASHVDFISGSSSVTVSQNRLVFTTSPQTLTPNECSSLMTVQHQDASGNPAGVSSTLPVALSSSSPGATFHLSDSTCAANAVTQMAMPPGTHTISFYYKDPSAGSPVITADAGTLTVWQQQLIEGSAGASCTVPADCASNFCVDGICCNVACACDACSAALGATQNGVCTILGNNSICRVSAGGCDPEERCNGQSAACPVNLLRGGGVECRAANGQCDRRETCDGVTTACPVDGFIDAGTVCRSSTGLCDPVETCTGVPPSCPDDLLSSTAVTCRPSAGDCDPAEQCSGSSASCPSDALYPPTVECRASAGACDPAEQCDGASASCPTNALAPPTVECRASAGACDPAGELAAPEQRLRAPGSPGERTQPGVADRSARPLRGALLRRG